MKERGLEPTSGLKIMDPDLVSPERLDPDSVNGRPDSKFNSAKEK